MNIFNIIGLFCFISVNGIEISSLESSPTQFENDVPQYNCSLLRMTVKGIDIKMSEIVNHECWSNANDIQIFALKRIVIDCDVIKNSAYLSIYANTWEPIGMRKIVLSGKDGEPHIPSTAQGYGTNGEPGLPGGAGGIFIGVGKHLINANELKIEADGGNGGPGQNGAKGIYGTNGDELLKENINKEPDDLKKYLKKHNLTYVETTVLGSVFRLSHSSLKHMLTIYGKMATSSGDGGDGGAGGLVGPPGIIYLSGLDEYPITDMSEGENGTFGKGGPPGIPAWNGRNVECVYAINFSGIVFRCKWSEPKIGPIGKYGIDGGNEVNRRGSQTPTDDNFTDVKNSFKEFVTMSLVNSGLELTSYNEILYL